MYYKKVKTKESLPEKGGYYAIETDKIIGNVHWSLEKQEWTSEHDGKMEATFPNYWLEEVDLSKMETNSKKWESLDRKISECYGKEDENGEWVEDEEKNCDLVTIGEIAAIHFGWL